MPSLTPPMLPQKPWRSKVDLGEGGWRVHGGVGESRRRGQARRGDRQRLEQGAHFARVEQAPSR